MQIIISAHIAGNSVIENLKRQQELEAFLTQKNLSFIVGAEELRGLSTAIGGLCVLVHGGQLKTKQEAKEFLSDLNHTIGIPAITLLTEHGARSLHQTLNMDGRTSKPVPFKRITQEAANLFERGAVFYFKNQYYGTAF